MSEPEALTDEERAELPVSDHFPDGRAVRKLLRLYDAALARAELLEKALDNDAHHGARVLHLATEGNELRARVATLIKERAEDAAVKRQQCDELSAALARAEAEGNGRAVWLNRALAAESLLQQFRASRDGARWARPIDALLAKRWDDPQSYSYGAAQDDPIPMDVNVPAMLDRIQAAESALTEATALLVNAGDDMPARRVQWYRERAAFLAAAPAPAAWDIRGPAPVLVPVPAAESEPDRVTRWNTCPAEPEEDDDGPLYQGFLTDPNGEWVKFEDVAPLQARIAELERELSSVNADRASLTVQVRLQDETYTLEIAAARQDLERFQEASRASNLWWQKQCDQRGASLGAARYQREALRAAIAAAVVELENHKEEGADPSACVDSAISLLRAAQKAGQ